jgi:hypothetical protein
VIKRKHLFPKYIIIFENSICADAHPAQGHYLCEKTAVNKGKFPFFA